MLSNINLTAEDLYERRSPRFVCVCVCVGRGAQREWSETLVTLAWGERQSFCINLCYAWWEIICVTSWTNLKQNAENKIIANNYVPLPPGWRYNPLLFACLEPRWQNVLEAKSSFLGTYKHCLLGATTVPCERRSSISRFLFSLSFRSFLLRVCSLASLSPHQGHGVKYELMMSFTCLSSSKGSIYYGAK